MILVTEENAINKQSVKALVKLYKKKKVIAMDIINLWFNYGLLVTTKDETDKLDKLLKEGRL